MSFVLAWLAVNSLEIASSLEKFSRVPSYCDMAMISKDCRIACILFIAELSSSGDSSIACGQSDVKHKEFQTWFCWCHFSLVCLPCTKEL